MAIREAWIIQDASIVVQVDDGSGDPATEEVLEPCSVQEIAIRPIHHDKLLLEPGVAYQQRCVHVVGYRIEIRDVAFERKASRFTPFLDGTVKWRIKIDLTNARYSGVAPFENDQFDFRGCTIENDTPEVRMPVGDVAKVSVNFHAERLAA